jgi:hypothetical protein
MKKAEVPNVLAPVSITVAVLLIGILISKAFAFLSFRDVVLATFSTAIAFSIPVGVALVFQGRRHQVELELIFNRLEELITRAPTDFPWLYRDQDLANAEVGVKGKSIWIVSPDLENVTEKPVIRSAVKSNMERGVNYSYIVPNTKHGKGAVPALEDLFKDNPGQLKLIWLAPEDFEMLTVTHIAIFNARGVGGAAPDVFIELPIEGGGKRSGFWIKAAKAAAKGVAGRFSEIEAGSNHGTRYYRRPDAK